MGITETIGATLDDYVVIAARLAKDAPWRATIKARIAANKHRVYRDRDCVAKLEAFLERAARGLRGATDDVRMAAALAPA